MKRFYFMLFLSLVIILSFACVLINITKVYEESQFQYTVEGKPLDSPLPEESKTEDKYYTIMI